MATTFDVENTKALRLSPNVAIRIIVGNSIRLAFYKSDIISIKCDLRGVETKLIDPQFQASTIEATLRYNGDTEALTSALAGRDAVIQYKCSYTEAQNVNFWNNDSPTKSSSSTVTQGVGIRAFYTSFDEDTIQIIDDHIIKIKGTDAVGAYQDNGHDWLLNLYPSWTTTSHSTSGTSHTYYNISEIISSYIGQFPCTKSVYQLGSAPSAYSRVLGNSTDWYYRHTLYRPEQSRRKKIARIMNILRGTKPDDTDSGKAMYKQYIFRDAGSPMRIWRDRSDEVPSLSRAYRPFTKHRNQNYSNNINNDSWVNGTWTIGYDEVADLKTEYGAAIKSIKVDNPGAARGFDIIVENDLHGNMSDIVTWDKPGVYMSYSTSFSVSSSMITVTQLSPTSLVLKTGSISGTGTITFRIVPLSTNYASGDPDYMTINTGLSYGDTVEFDAGYWLSAVTGYLPDWTTAVNSIYLENSIKKAAIYLGLRQPKWITFKWRGHPAMQPRDISCFTEKDGTRNIYEIESLTLDHEDGGLTSTVKAIYVRGAGS